MQYIIHSIYVVNDVQGAGVLGVFPLTLLVATLGDSKDTGQKILIRAPKSKKQKYKLS